MKLKDIKLNPPYHPFDQQICPHCKSDETIVDRGIVDNLDQSLKDTYMYCVSCDAYFDMLPTKE